MQPVDSDNIDNIEESVLLSKIQREYLLKQVSDEITLSYIKESDIPSIIEMGVCIESLIDVQLEIDAELFMKSFQNNFNETVFNGKQMFYFRYEDLTLKCLVTDLKNSDKKNQKIYGVLKNSTKIKPTSLSKKIHIKSKQIPSLDLLSLGIGGLTKEFTLMFRRAFLQRTLSTDLVERLGTENIKGIILYGPPGTGKTLIARKISSLLNSRPPKVVSGPEILDKYVGESEKNIRELFREAEEEYTKKGEASALHIIIFDEIDAICKQRSLSGSNHSDNIVNQILAKMDGIDQLNNVLVIGMTNRIDLIDSALLRPGRFEIKIEISLPNQDGRVEIFNIHTQRLKDSRLFGTDIDPIQISKRMVNYTGAEIAAVVKSAVSFALERSTSKSKQNVISINEDTIKVLKEDFEKGILEIKPLFGNSPLPSPLVYYNFPVFRSIVEESLQKISNLKRTELYDTASLLLYGERGSGKTSLAARIAEGSDIPFIRIISPSLLVGLDERDRVNYIKSIFLDAYKSVHSLIILDDLESLIDYVSIGPRFSNSVLQCLKLFVTLKATSISSSENSNVGKVFVIGTCVNEHIVSELGLWECFDSHLEAPLISRECLDSLRRDERENKDLNVFSDLELDRDVPVKKLLGLLNV